MRVLSLFDGISCGMVALERAAIPVEEYIAYEIEPSAIKISEKNYPQIIHCGDVTKADFTQYKGKIDLLIGGSPCQGFSFAGKQLNFDDLRSKLFFEYVRALKESNPKYFLLENVKMKKEWIDTISDYLGVEPIKINSSLVSAQNRIRLYWTNIPNITQPADKNIILQDVLLETQENEKIGKFKNCIRKNVLAEYEKIISSDKTIYIMQCTSGWNDNKVGLRKTTTIRANNSFCLVKDKEDRIRLISPEEAEILQTLPLGYTDCVDRSKRFKAIGNGWTVDVITHIFKNLKGDI